MVEKPRTGPRLPGSDDGHASLFTIGTLAHMRNVASKIMTGFKSRRKEREADSLSVTIATRAGYDAKEGIQWLLKVQSDEEEPRGWFARLYASHPPEQKRFDRLLKECHTHDDNRKSSEGIQS